jgi:large subunit ribosomal protein L30
MLRIKLVKSPIGNTKRNRATVAALGLRKVQQVIDQPDNGSIRGMIHHVQHLVTFEVIEGEVVKKNGKTAKAAARPAASKGAGKGVRGKDSGSDLASTAFTPSTMPEPKPAKAKKGAEAPIEETVETPGPVAEAKPKRATKKTAESAEENA